MASSNEINTYDPVPSLVLCHALDRMRPKAGQGWPWE